jgi:hypothetical protein
MSATSSASTVSAEDAAAIRAILDRQGDAWNRHDMDAFVTDMMPDEASGADHDAFIGRAFCRPASWVRASGGSTRSKRELDIIVPTSNSCSVSLI